MFFLGSNSGDATWNILPTFQDGFFGVFANRKIAPETCVVFFFLHLKGFFFQGTCFERKNYVFI